MYCIVHVKRYAPLWSTWYVLLSINILSTSQELCTWFAALLCFEADLMQVSFVHISQCYFSGTGEVKRFSAGE